jgi:hypothetical protein
MEEAMSAFFGMDAQGSEEFLNHGSVCMDKTTERETVLLTTFRGIRTEDIIFIKNFSPETGISIKAVGVVLSGLATENESTLCMPVEWCWRGEKHIEVSSEEYSHCNDYIYEEYNIWIQREILQLLPKKFQLAEEW